LREAHRLAAIARLVDVTDRLRVQGDGAEHADREDAMAISASSNSTPRCPGGDKRRSRQLPSRRTTQQLALATQPSGTAVVLRALAWSIV